MAKSVSPCLYKRDIRLTLFCVFRLLVIIGFTAGFIISLFPKPQSAKVTVRKSLATAIDSIAELYTEEVKGFLLEARLYDNRNQQPLDVEERATRYRTRFLGLIVSLYMANALHVSGSSLFLVGQTAGGPSTNCKCKIRTRFTWTVAQGKV